VLTPEIIRICRLNLDLSQGQLGRMAGLSGATIGAIERHDRPLLPDVARRIRESIALTDDQIEELVRVTKEIKKRGKNDG